MPVPDFTVHADRGSISHVEIMKNPAETNGTLDTHRLILTSGHKPKLVNFFLLAYLLSPCGSVTLGKSLSLAWLLPSRSTGEHKRFANRPKSTTSIYVPLQGKCLKVIQNQLKTSDHRRRCQNNSFKTCGQLVPVAKPVFIES